MSVHLSPAGISRTAALSAVASLAERWGVQKTDRHLLLAVPESTANHWFSDLANGRLDASVPIKPATMERISHLLSIYDMVHRLVDGPEADVWVNNANRAFAGRKPIELILSGRSDELLQVRWYVERVVSQ